MATYFDEILFDPDLLRGQGSNAAQQGWPEYANTSVEHPASGIRQTVVNRYDAIYKITVPSQDLTETQAQYLLSFWHGGYGSAIGFRVKLPWDYKATLEGFGTGDGTTTQFPLYRTHRRKGAATLFSGGTIRTNSRRICKPVVQVAKETNSFQLYMADGTTTRTPTTSLAIYDNGVAATGWTCNAKTGVVTFSSAPVAGHALTWTGEYDVPMTFDANTLQHVFDVLSTVNGIPLREILYSELGIT